MHKKIVVLTCLKQYARASGDPRERLAVTFTAAEDAAWYSDASALHRNQLEGLHANLDFGVCITRQLERVNSCY